MPGTFRPVGDTSRKWRAGAKVKNPPQGRAVSRVRRLQMAVSGDVEMGFRARLDGGRSIERLRAITLCILPPPLRLEKQSFRLANFFKNSPSSARREIFYFSLHVSCGSEL